MNFWTDDASKNAFLNDNQKILNTFWTTFLGFLGMKHLLPNDQQVNQYFKTDQKLQYAHINETNHDLSFIIKIMSDKGFITDVVRDRITRMLALLKMSKVVALDETKIRETILKSLMKTNLMPDARIKDDVQDFYNAKKTLSEIILPLFNFAKMNDISADFVKIGKLNLSDIDNALKKISSTATNQVAQQTTAKTNPNPGRFDKIFEKSTDLVADIKNSQLNTELGLAVLCTIVDYQFQEFSSDGNVDVKRLKSYLSYFGNADEILHSMCMMIQNLNDDFKYVNFDSSELSRYSFIRSFIAKHYSSGELVNLSSPSVLKLIKLNSNYNGDVRLSAFDSGILFSWFCNIKVVYEFFMDDAIANIGYVVRRESDPYYRWMPMFGMKERADVTPIIYMILLDAAGSTLQLTNILSNGNRYYRDVFVDSALTNQSSPRKFVTSALLRIFDTISVDKLSEIYQKTIFRNIMPKTEIKIPNEIMAKIKSDDKSTQIHNDAVNKSMSNDYFRDKLFVIQKVTDLSKVTVEKLFEDIFTLNCAQFIVKYNLCPWELIDKKNMWGEFVDLLGDIFAGTKRFNFERFNRFKSHEVPKEFIVTLYMMMTDESVMNTLIEKLWIPYFEKTLDYFCLTFSTISNDPIRSKLIKLSLDVMKRKTLDETSSSRNYLLSNVTTEYSGSVWYSILEEYLKQLPDDERSVFILRRICGFDPRNATVKNITDLYNNHIILGSRLAEMVTSYRSQLTLYFMKNFPDVLISALTSMYDLNISKNKNSVSSIFYLISERFKIDQRQLILFLVEKNFIDEDYVSSVMQLFFTLLTKISFDNVVFRSIDVFLSAITNNDPAKIEQCVVLDLDDLRTSITDNFSDAFVSYGHMQRAIGLMKRESLSSALIAANKIFSIIGKELENVVDELKKKDASTDELANIFADKRYPVKSFAIRKVFEKIIQGIENEHESIDEYLESVADNASSNEITIKTMSFFAEKLNIDKMLDESYDDDSSSFFSNYTKIHKLLPSLKINTDALDNRLGKYYDYVLNHYSGSNAKKKLIEDSEDICGLASYLYEEDVDAFNAFCVKANNKNPGFMNTIKNKVCTTPVLKKLLDNLSHSQESIRPLVEVSYQDFSKKLKYNNFSITSKQQYLDRETPAQYVDRVISKLEKDKSLLPALKSVKADISTEELELMNAVFYKHYTNNEHGQASMKILEVHDVNLVMPEYDEFKAKPGVKEQFPLFHGCGSIAASLILRFGFRVLPASMAMAGRALGSGIYVANHCNKSLGYLSDQQKNFTRRIGQVGYILLCSVLFGQVNVDYREAGTSSRNSMYSFLAPEYVLPDPRAQIRIRRAFKVVIVPRSEMQALVEKYADKIDSYKDEKILGIMK